MGFVRGDDALLASEKLLLEAKRLLLEVLWGGMGDSGVGMGRKAGLLETFCWKLIGKGGGFWRGMVWCVFSPTHRITVDFRVA